MAIIPVIDLLDGQVVHARGGVRANYAPVQSSLCPSSEPKAVLTALLTLHTGITVYIADLGAMLGRQRHDDVVDKLRADFPDLIFWLDNGETQAQTNRPGVRAVIGTETGLSASALHSLALTNADFILSLDFNATGFLGDAEILEHPEFWPADIIIMSLASVGTVQGPAWAIIDDVMQRTAQRNFYLAGGVRNTEDLVMAEARGLKGALVATALHEGGIASHKL